MSIDKTSLVLATVEVMDIVKQECPYSYSYVYKDMSKSGKLKRKIHVYGKTEELVTIILHDVVSTNRMLDSKIQVILKNKPAQVLNLRELNKVLKCYFKEHSVDKYSRDISAFISIDMHHTNKLDTPKIAQIDIKHDSETGCKYFAISPIDDDIIILTGYHSDILQIYYNKFRTKMEKLSSW